MSKISTSSKVGIFSIASYSISSSNSSENSSIFTFISKLPITVFFVKTSTPRFAVKSSPFSFTPWICNVW